ncbi:MAG: GNAT family N-acetyltransferase [Spirochaetes bacterium]|nr:GNAT family N-acetyltransferase [Spirochaetota bacterium]
MENLIITRNENISARELNELYRTNQWQIEPVEKLEKSLKTIWGCITARTPENELIGFVEVISDGIQHAYILKMIVHPDYRRQGIGSRIMKELMNLLNENKMLPTLVSTPGNEKFYEKFGFKTVCHGLTAMCIR